MPSSATLTPNPSIERTLGRMVTRSSLPTLLATFLVSGCVPYPVYKTLQPDAKATVRDAQGKPVSGAAVTLVASAYPYGRERSREMKMTMEDGVSAFASRREWRTEILAMHGAEEYFWNWCVQKEGFETFRTAHGRAAGFKAEPVIILKAGESKPCTQSIR
jgi:hypothetical protein